MLEVGRERVKHLCVCVCVCVFRVCVCCVRVARRHCFLSFALPRYSSLPLSLSRPWRLLPLCPRLSLSLSTCTAHRDAPLLYFPFSPCSLPSAARADASPRLPPCPPSRLSSEGRAREGRPPDASLSRLSCPDAHRSQAKRKGRVERSSHHCQTHPHPPSAAACDVNALAFDGVSSYVSVPAIGQGYDTLTLEVGRRVRKCTPGAPSLCPWP